MTFIAEDLIVRYITIPAAPGEGSSHYTRTTGQGGVSSDTTSAGTARVNTLTHARTRTHARSHAHEEPFDRQERCRHHRRVSATGVRVSAKHLPEEAAPLQTARLHQLSPNESASCLASGAPLRLQTRPHPLPQRQRPHRSNHLDFRLE